MDWYAYAAALGHGVIDAAAETEFRREFAGKLKPGQIDRLVRWHRDVVEQRG